VIFHEKTNQAADSRGSAIGRSERIEEDVSSQPNSVKTVRAVCP